MRVNRGIKLLLVVVLTLASGTACRTAQAPADANMNAPAGAVTNASPAPSQTPNAEPQFEAFQRGASPPELTVEARAGAAVGGSGGERIEFGGVMKDADMVSVAQYRIARKEGAEWKLAARWMAIILGGGQWDEPSGRYTGASMQHMRVEPGVYRIIVRAEDSTGAVAQAVSNEVTIR